MCDMSCISTGSGTPLKGVRHSTPGKSGWNKVGSLTDDSSLDVIYIY